MRTIFGRAEPGTPILLLHGGEGGMARGNEPWGSAAIPILRAIAERGFGKLKTEKVPLDVVAHCLEELENEECFNAGYGSALQADGRARLSASMMDGPQRKFSAVALATDLIHPSKIAYYLQEKKHRVLSAPGAELIARSLNLPIADPVSAARAEQWLNRRSNERFGGDTVGCVLRTSQGDLYGGLSTGGTGNEMPGRMSDSVTVAGLYAGSGAAAACTGIGEQIVDDAVAAKIDARCSDGMSLEEACSRAYEEAKSRGREYGWIATDNRGFWAVCYTMKTMAYAVVTTKDIVTSDN